MATPSWSGKSLYIMIVINSGEEDVGCAFSSLICNSRGSNVVELPRALRACRQSGSFHYFSCFQQFSSESSPAMVTTLQYASRRWEPVFSSQFDLSQFWERRARRPNFHLVTSGRNKSNKTPASGSMIIIYRFWPLATVWLSSIIASIMLT